MGRKLYPFTFREAVAQLVLTISIVFVLDRYGILYGVVIAIVGGSLLGLGVRRTRAKRSRSNGQL